MADPVTAPSHKDIDSLVASCFAVDFESVLGDLVFHEAFTRRFGVSGSDEMDEALVEDAFSSADQWMRANATLWQSAATIPVVSLGERAVVLTDGAKLESAFLVSGFAKAKTSSVVVAGFSAGQAIDVETKRLWEQGRPDEAQALASYGIALIEHLREVAWKRLAVEGAKLGIGVLPHYSPGYEGWDLKDQRTLFELLKETGPLRLLDSFMLSPNLSTLTAFGLSGGPVPEVDRDFWEALRAQAKPRTSDSRGYAFSSKVLRKWSRDRLSVEQSDAETVEASFRIDGSTCANMGLPLAMDYRVRLKRGAGERDWVIQDFACAPAPDDRGHRSTCLHLSDAAAFHAVTKERPPLEGRPIDEVLSWQPDLSPAGCLCTQASRDHKWSAALQTLHFALANEMHSLS